MWVHLNPKSGNRKVGDIPVSTTEEGSCPNECPLKGTDCYARFGPLGMHWKKVHEGARGDNWTAFCKRMRQFVAGTLFRHNQAGDLPQNKRGLIHRSKLRQLVAAVAHLRGWTYTHYDPTVKHNADAIKHANDNGFTVNLSADTLEQADEYVQLDIGPVVTILPQDAPDRGNVTPNGLPIVVCPAQLRDDMDCKQCKLCTVRDRKSIVGFRAHGTASKRLSTRIERGQNG
jgi:hypothetical protein